jgi:hypothetical protein
MITTKHILATATAVAITAAAALAQAPKQAQQAAPQPQQAQQPQQAPQPQQAQQAQQQAVIWERMQRMTLEAEFAGPLKDTTIQRWHDPATDMFCYLYVPFTAQHSPPAQNGYVVYGPNTIGSISCVPGHLAGVAAASPKAAPPTAKAAAKSQ